jgi:TolA-binding protein
VTLLPALAQAAPPPAPEPVRGPDGFTADELKEIDDLQKSVARFELGARQYRRTIHQIVQRDYEQKRREIKAIYDKEIRVEEVDERARRVDAIASFERFLQRYPQDRRWTPDALFRLAELHFEKSNDEYLAATEDYEKRLRAGQQAAQPQQNYSQTIALYRRLLIEFPQYRLIDGAYYLLGYCLGEQGQDQEARQAYLALVCRNRHSPPLQAVAEAKPAPRTPRDRARLSAFEDPYRGCVPVVPKSKFLAEAWTRIGEFHFDYNELDLAIAAYLRVLDDKDSPYFDKALYKLAWTYYRADKFRDAIKRFDELVEYSDNVLAASGKTGSDLRVESVQYLGISFSEDWGDGQPDLNTILRRIEEFYQGRENRKHVREIYWRVGDILNDQARELEAVAVWKKAIEKWPYAAENPELQEKIVTALERKRLFDQAVVERDRLVENFKEGSEWWNHNLNAALRAKTKERRENQLIQAAVFHHKTGQEARARCQELKEARSCEIAKKEYAIAAEQYDNYLKRFPNSKNAYELLFYKAETLYWSQKWEAAAAAYAVVRDSNLDNRYAEEAAFSVVKSWENRIEELKQQGQYREGALPSPKSLKGKQTAVPLHPAEQGLVGAIDGYLRTNRSNPKANRLSYKAAEIYQRHLDFEKSRPRFAAMSQLPVTSDTDRKLCEDSVRNILDSYIIENDTNRLEEATNTYKKSCGGKFGAEIGKLQAGIRFKRADDLFNKAQYEQATKLYLEILERDPTDPDADKALNNAAVGMEKVNRFESATRVYEKIYREYPNSKFADYALFRAAVNYQRFFEFDKAVSNYLILVDSPRFSKSEHKLNALYNAAQLLEGDQNYARAAEQFKRYSQLTSKPEDAAEAHFRAGVNYEKLKDTNRMVQTFRDFQKRYAGQTAQAGRIVEASYKIGKSYAERRNRREAEVWYKRAISDGSRVAGGSDAAEFAAKAQFELIEPQFEAYQKLRINATNVKAVKREVTKFKDQAAKLSSTYRDVWRFKRINWTLASMYRQGAVFEHFSQTLVKSPCPTQIKRLGDEACDLYREAIEKEVESIEAEALKRYKRTLDEAKKFGVANEWTKKALGRLNAYKPNDYPLLKDERIDVIEDPSAR